MKYLILILFLFGCRASKINFAKECAERYPVKDNLVLDTLYIPSLNEDYTDVINSIDSLASHLQNTVIKEKIVTLKQSYKPYKPDTVIVSKYILRENTALVAALQAQNLNIGKELTKCISEKHEAQKTADNRLLWIIIFALLLAGTLFFEFTNPLNKQHEK